MQQFAWRHVLRKETTGGTRGPMRKSSDQLKVRPQTPEASSFELFLLEPFSMFAVLLKRNPSVAKNGRGVR